MTLPSASTSTDAPASSQVGWAYSIIATPLALSQILNPSAELLVDRVYGFGVREARLSAFAAGYFFWDAYVSAQHINTQGLGFFLHGAGCCIAFMCTLTPFLLYCGPNFLIVSVLAGLGRCQRKLTSLYALSGSSRLCRSSWEPIRRRVQLLTEPPHSFLNLHWYLDKFGMTGSTLQLINGGFLLCVLSKQLHDSS